MSVLEIQAWAAIGVPLVMSLITLVVSLRIKSNVTTLAISVDGRLTALLVAKEAESQAKVGEASALGEAVGRSAERLLQAEGAKS